MYELLLLLLFPQRLLRLVLSLLALLLLVTEVCRDRTCWLRCSCFFSMLRNKSSARQIGGGGGICQLFGEVNPGHGENVGVTHSPNKGRLLGHLPPYLQPVKNEIITLRRREEASPGLFSLEQSVSFPPPSFGAISAEWCLLTVVGNTIHWRRPVAVTPRPNLFQLVQYWTNWCSSGPCRGREAYLCSAASSDTLSR